MLYRPSRPSPPLPPPSGAIPKDYLLTLAGKYGISFGPGSYGGLNPLTGELLPGMVPPACMCSPRRPRRAASRDGAPSMHVLTTAPSPSPQARSFRDGAPSTN